MENLILPAPAPVLLPVAGTDARFPVRRIFCVGLNYADHAREMGGDPQRSPPFFFSKPADAATSSGQTLPFPVATENLHHEAELVVAIGKGGSNITPQDAETHIWGFAAGNDLTRRDLQAAAKAAGRPWSMAKGFDNSAVIGALHPISETGNMTSGFIRGSVDGTLRQDGNLSDMIWPTNDVIAFLSRLVTLQPGDLIMTGTPSGVGQILPGQTCSISIQGLSDAEISFT